MLKDNSIFNLLGIDIDSINSKLSDISLKDYIKTNETITGAFNELSDEKKKKVVDSMNKIQDTFSDLFGTKKEHFTEEDFNGAKVNVSTKVYDSEKDSDETDEKEDVFTEAPETDDYEEPIDKESKDETPETFDRESCKGCENYDDCLSVYKDAVCDSQTSCNGCEFEDECSETDDDYFDEDEESTTICDELLSELEDEDTPDEEVVDSIVEYVLAILGEKTHKKYILHPATDTVPPAVEVNIPEDIASADILENIHIMTMLRDMLIDTTGAHDAYINHGKGKSIVVYIPLKKK